MEFLVRKFFWLSIGRFLLALGLGLCLSVRPSVRSFVRSFVRFFCSWRAPGRRAAKNFLILAWSLRREFFFAWRALGVGMIQKFVWIFNEI